MEPITKRCGNCRTELKFLKRENIQLGKTSLFWGDWPNLLAGAMDTEFWVCPHCGKLEFFLSSPEEALAFEESGDSIAQITCPVCGVSHDMDDPKCPACGAKNTLL